MLHGPVRLLLCAYGAAALAAAGLIVFGVGIVAATLTFWIGGALAVPALALAPGLRALFRRDAAQEDAPSDEIDAALAAWRKDSAQDRGDASEVRKGAA